jgi:hypothetical protein
VVGASRTTMTTFCAAGCQRDLHLYILLFSLGNRPPLAMEKLVKALQTVPARRPSRPTASCIVLAFTGCCGANHNSTWLCCQTLLFCGGAPSPWDQAGEKRAWWIMWASQRCFSYASVNDTHARSFAAFLQGKLLTRQILVPGPVPTYHRDQRRTVRRRSSRPLCTDKVTPLRTTQSF